MTQIFNLGCNAAFNNYLISTEVGYVLIDTAYEGGFKYFTNKINKFRINPKEIRYVFLTHAHDDHAGFLNDVLDTTDAKVILHPKAIERLKKGQNSFEGGCSNLLADLFCQYLALCGKGEHRFPAIREEFLSRLITIDSEEFHALNLPFKVLETPGHTADHISLLIDDKLFCGDAAMNILPSIKRVTIWIENLQQFKQSWQMILAAAPKTIYPAHGWPFPTSDLKKYLPALDKIKLRPLK